jgi:hypothetical protein
MRTPTSLLLVLAAAAALLATAAPAGAASSWSATQGFTAGGPRDIEPIPRAAIASDGTSALAFETRSDALMLATGKANGTFGSPRLIARSGARDHSIAAARGGAFLLAWESADGLHAAVRTRAGRAIVRRLYPGGPDSEINGVQVAADPHGGWVIARRVFALHGSAENRVYGVRALSLDRAGRLLGPVQDLGPGQFGIDARPTQALAVGADGRAVLAFRREVPPLSSAPRPVGVTTRPHGGVFAAPIAVPVANAVEPRVAVDGAGHAIVAFTRVSRCGDVGCFGAPAAVNVLADGSTSPPAGPVLDFPGRAFAPSVAYTGVGAAIVFQLKSKSAAFSTEAPVMAVTLNADGTVGGLQTLTNRLAGEPVAMPISRGRVLAVWEGSRGLGAALAVNGVFAKTAEPKGPPPSTGHSNSTNRDLRTAGRYAIFAWARAGRVRVAVRAF